MLITLINIARGAEFAVSENDAARKNNN